MKIRERSRISQGVPTPEADVLIYYFTKNFVENCMKIKEFGLREGERDGAPPWIHQNILALEGRCVQNFTIPQTKFGPRYCFYIYVSFCFLGGVHRSGLIPPKQHLKRAVCILLECTLLLCRSAWTYKGGEFSICGRVVSC